MTKTDPKECLKIQWSETYTINGVPCCPSCNAEAEMVIGLFGNPCWAHKIKTSKKRGRPGLGGKRLIL